MKEINRSVSGYIFIALILLCTNSQLYSQEREGIDYYTSNKSYWQYNGIPILLLGGSSEDNLFQIDSLENEIEIIKSCGANYVRNTLSSRDSGNVWAFGKDKESGLYNLSTWNPEYWKRLENLFDLTSEHDIIVQVELWATFDFYREHWDKNPFNPKNNVNYSYDRVKIDTVISSHPIYCENSFFQSVPLLDNNMRVLEYQQKFIDKVLSYSLKYGNILYCIDNETSVSASWGKFWAEYIKKVADENGKRIHVTEMWDPHHLDHISHRETFDHPETYSFIEISQNNHKKGQEHWDNGLRQVNRLQKPNLKRPVNNVKTYGNDGGRHGHGSQNGMESFVRNIFFGSASSRFHRPSSGLGLSQKAQSLIKSLRTATQSIDFFGSSIGNHLLLNRENNEAYCRYNKGKEYLIFFPKGGDVAVRVPPNVYSLSWLNAENTKWDPALSIKSEGVIQLSVPDSAMWFMLIKNDSN